MGETRPDIVAADWLVPMDGTGRAIRRGGARVDSSGRIAAVGPADDIRRAGDRIRFFPDCVLTPGLVNAHTHLDLGPIGDTMGRGPESSTGTRDEPKPGRRYTAGPLHEWVLEVLAQRQSLTADAVAAIAVAGARQSVAAGVTTVIDVTPARFAWPAVQQALAAMPIRRLALMEILGFADRGRQFWDDAQRLLEAPSVECQAPNQEPCVQSGTSHPALGISPHAPYSTSPTIYERSLALARDRGWPIMTHLSETREEIEFCRTGTGPWRDLQERRYGPLSPSPMGGGSGRGDFPFAIPGCSPVAFAAQLGLLDYERTLLAHVNYLEPGDLELLAGVPGLPPPPGEGRREGNSAPGRVTVVYCPRTADYFGHRDHPWRELLAAGVNVAIGTDSLASAPDLSIMNELRFLHERFPDVPAGELFALAAANSLPFGSRLNGSISPGAIADLVAWPVGAADGSADLILLSVIESKRGPGGVFVAGEAIATGSD